MPDNGYFYGIGAFETIAIENGTLEYFDLHLERLQKTMDFFQLPYSKELVIQQVALFLEENRAKLTGHDALKLALSEQEHSLSLRQNPYTSEHYQKGFQVAFSPILRNETSPLTYHKTLCYAENLLEKRRIVKEGKDEVLFLNTKGEITEGSTANIFFVRQGRLFTPPVSCGLLPGIIRSWLCSHFNVTEQIIYPEDLETFDGAFFTNSLMKRMPIKKIGTVLYQ